MPYALVTIELEKLSGLDLGRLYGAARRKMLNSHREDLQSKKKRLVRFLKNLIVGPQSLAGEHRIYAIARLRVKGTSRQIEHGPSPSVAHDAQEVTLGWQGRFYLERDEQIEVTVSLWADRGDVCPLLLLSYSDQSYPARNLKEGEETFVSGVKDLQLSGRIYTTRVPAAATSVLRLARSPSRDPKASTSNVNLVQSTPPLVIGITRVTGLYRPLDEQRWKDGLLIQAVEEDGYTSQDGLGRIYISRTPDGAFRASTQCIDLHAELVLPGVRELDRMHELVPRLRWRAAVPDHPSDFHPSFHRDARAILDAPIQQAPLAWQESSETGVVAATETTAPIVWSLREGDTVGTTSVRLHCPDVGGARLAVYADLPPDSQFPGKIFPAWTGTMTLWKRIYVDVFRMKGAKELPFEKVPLFFADAMVELVFTRETQIDDVDPIFDGDDVSRLEAECLRFVNNIFDGQPGRFCLMAALTPCLVSHGKETEPVPHKFEHARIGHGVQTGAGGFSLTYIEVPGDFTEKGTRVNQAMVVLDPNPGAPSFFTGQVAEAELVPGPPLSTRLWLAGDDLAVEFTGHDADGSVHHSSLGTRLYFPGREAAAPMAQDGKVYDLSNIRPEAGGYPIVNPEDAEVWLSYDAATGLPGGMSPLAESGGRMYFAGRTLCFTATEGYEGTPETMVPFLVHELAHAFGTPHKCGRFDRRTPAMSVCAMNYPEHWLIGPDGDVKPRGKPFREDPFLCARHLRAIRTVRLERNPALGWGG